MVLHCFKLLFPALFHQFAKASAAFFQQFAVSGHGKAGQRCIAVLALAQEIAGAAQLQILPGDHKAVRRFAQRFEAFVGFRHEEAPALLRTAPHAPAQLMQLRKAKALCVLNDHHGGRRHIDAHFDHRGSDQHVQLPG